MDARYRRRPPPPPPPRAPPPLTCPALPKLLFPRLLLARTALPLNPALPKALAEPKFAETPWLPIRSPPTPLGRIPAFAPARTPLESPVLAPVRSIPVLFAPGAPPLTERLAPAVPGWRPDLAAYLFAVLLSAYGAPPRCCGLCCHAPPAGC